MDDTKASELRAELERAAEYAYQSSRLCSDCLSDMEDAVDILIAVCKDLLEQVEEDGLCLHRALPPRCPALSGLDDETGEEPEPDGIPTPTAEDKPQTSEPAQPVARKLFQEASETPPLSAKPPIPAAIPIIGVTGRIREAGEP